MHQLNQTVLLTDQKAKTTTRWLLRDRIEIFLFGYNPFF